MDKKKLRRNIRYFFGWLGFIFCSLIIKIIPKNMLYHFASLMGKLAYIFAVRHRRIALESLKIAFANKLPFDRCKKIAKKSFINMAKSGLEMLFLIDKPQLIKKHVDLVNKENLDNALKDNKGVILVSAHFGNFALMMAKLSLEGYKISGIMRQMRDERIERVFFKKRSILGIKTIYSQPRKICVDNTIRALRNNEVVFIPLDQNFGTGGIFVDFFGKKAATATGPVIFAQRTGAKIIPCFTIRTEDNRHKVIFETELRLEEGSSQEEFVHRNIQKITSIIESYIRKQPEEWSWIHRRWKTQPSE